MLRGPRLALTDYPLRIVQRGNDRQPCFFAEADYRTYLQAMADASAHYAVRIHVCGEIVGSDSTCFSGFRPFEIRG